MVNLARRLEALRLEKGLSRPELAAALGLPRLSVEKFETGRQTPNQDQQQRMADYFGVSLFYLRGESDERTSMENWLSGNLPPEEPLQTPPARPAVVARSADGGRTDGAVFGALLKSDSFRAMVRETVLEVLCSPEGRRLLADAVRRQGKEV